MPPFRVMSVGQLARVNRVMADNIAYLIESIFSSIFTVRRSVVDLSVVVENTMQNVLIRSLLAKSALFRTLQKHFFQRVPGKLN